MTPGQKICSNDNWGCIEKVSSFVSQLSDFGSFRPSSLNKCPGCFQKIHIIAYHLELTVPWEERMEEEHERKKVNYQPLLDACQRQG
ncbi:hypothetical protein DPMN_050002 [Dreissena polymorpha]|uniref:Uncharacterized protein n=1 Tax=Dreissena polymorpha TaxID=45954 RepID=A0A9D4CGZ0_DREPO|nr:hypothetical protein DPMN_050002 [Dreissena polymorpha]